MKGHNFGLCRKFGKEHKHSYSRLGKKTSEETKKKQSKSMIQRYNDYPDLRKNLSELKKKYIFTTETRKKISEKRTGIKHSEDTKKQMSFIQTKKYLEHPEIKKKISETLLKKYKEFPELRNKRSKSALKTYKEHPEILEKISKTLSTIYKDKELRKKCVERRMNQKFSNSYTKIEVKLSDALKCNNMPNFVTQYPFYKTIIDIAFPEERIAIYCDGDYWHNLPGRKEKDIKINNFLKTEGWTVLRFWEHDINNNIDKCIEEVEKILKSF